MSVVVQSRPFAGAPITSDLTLWTDIGSIVRHVSKVRTGDIEMKEVAIECANYVFFLPPTLAMVASRVIGQLHLAYPHPGLRL